MAYDYLSNVTEDVIAAIRDTYTEEEIKDWLTREDEFAEKLHDDLWADDSVTGNGSGSYTFSTYQAEENLAHNWDLLAEAAYAFGCEPTISDEWKNGAEYWDVTIRCYLLGNAISMALTELKKEGEN